MNSNQIKEIADIIEAILHKEQGIVCSLVDSSFEGKRYLSNSLYLRFRGVGNYRNYDDELAESIIDSNRVSEIKEILLPNEIDSVEVSFHYDDWEESFDGNMNYWYYFSATIYFK